MIPFIDQYEKLLADLSSTLNGRISNVISSQARDSVGTVVTATSISAEPNELDVLYNTLPTNISQRSSTFESVVKREYVQPPTLVVWLTVRALWAGEKAVVVLSSSVEFFGSDPNDGTTIVTDPYIASYTAAPKSITELKKFFSRVLAGPINTRLKAYLTAVNVTRLAADLPPIDRALVAIEDNMIVSPDVEDLIETGLADLKSDVTGLVEDEVDDIKEKVNEEITKVLEEIENEVEDIKSDIEDIKSDIEKNVNNVTNATGTDDLGGEIPTGTGSGSSSTNTNQTNESNRKYLSIEAIDDDDVDELLVRSDSTDFVRLGVIEDDDELLTREDSAVVGVTPRKSTAQKDVENIVGEEDGDSRSGVTPYIPPKVSHREYEQTVAETEAQRKGEFSDALLKEKSKEKSSISPAGPNTLIEQAGGLSNVSDLLEEQTKPEAKPKQNPTAKYFLEWAAAEGADPNGIIYRGENAWEYTKPPTPRPEITYGKVERRYKNLFNFGKDLKGIFSGYQANSPVDVALLMNSGAIGRFNKNWPYMFGEGSEIHAAIIRSSPSFIDDKQLGGFGIFGAGKKYASANWGADPHWCGLFADFALHTNGLYESDSKLVSIVATKSVESLYKNSPFNTVPKNLTAKEKKRILDKLDELRADTTGTNTDEIAELENKIDGKPTFNASGNCALFLQGEHWTSSGLTANGVDLLNRIKDWPGAFCVRRHPHKNGGHVEVLLHMTKTGKLYTIGGNTGLNDSNGNGSEYGVKRYNSVHEFCSRGTYTHFYIYKRGTSNPYTNGIGVSVKKTELYNKYVKDLDSDKELNTASYNILREIMET